MAFPKTKITFERKEISDHWWDSGKMAGQLMSIGRTVWGPKVPTLKGTEVSLSFIQCFLHLLSSSVNVSFSYYIDGCFLDRPHVYIFILTWGHAYWVLEWGQGKEREGKKHWFVVSSKLPEWQTNPKPRYVPWLGIKRAIFQFTGDSNQVSHTG